MTNVMVSSLQYAPRQEGRRAADFADLLKPSWKNKLTMDSQSYVWFGTILQHLGEEAGLKFMRQLNEQNPSHQRGRRLMTQLVAAGEFDMAVETNLNSVLSLNRQGAPLSFARMPPFFLSPSLAFVTAGAVHPYAAALFMDYLLSEEGQKVIITTNRMPAHVKVRSPESQLLEGQDVRIAQHFDIGRRYQAIGNQYREIFPTRVKPNPGENMSNKPRITLGLPDHPRCRALIDGKIGIEGYDLDIDPEFVSSGERHYKFLHGQWDVGECSAASLLRAVERGQELLAIPVFFERGPRQRNIYHCEGKLKHPSELKGKKFGCFRYGATAVVWARGFLLDAYDIQTKDMEWFVSGREVFIEHELPVKVAAHRAAAAFRRRETVALQTA